MAVNTFNFTTGPATLPDVGTLSYNGCIFSPLFESSLSGAAIEDEAKRTVKLIEYALTVDGYVTLPAANRDISDTMTNMVLLLTAQAGVLIYNGRGFDLSINAVAGAVFNDMARDVAWGPVPELIEFQPLGGGLSAKVRWRVVFRLVNAPAQKSSGFLGLQKSNQQPLLQFNCETTVTYGEDYYSGLSVTGVMEVPLNRTIQSTRTLKQTVDDARSQLDTRIFAGIDLNRFRVVRRDYHVSRDKRVLTFDVAVEEKPYMDLPPGCTLARGTFSFRPAKTGMGLCLWLCTLRATYTVARGYQRRLAWLAFLALLRLRMQQSERPPPISADEKDQNPPKNPARFIPLVLIGTGLGGVPIDMWKQFFQANKTDKVKDKRRAFLIDFSGDEGLYLDSKTTSFSATWRLVTQFNNILIHSGLWRKVPEQDAKGNNLWAASVKGVSGSRSWLPNKIDPALDVIVDFGGG